MWWTQTFAGGFASVSAHKTTAVSCRSDMRVGWLQGQVADNVVDMCVGALQHGLTAESLVALLNGNVSDSGVDTAPFRDLGGCLGRLAEEERCIGGSLTELIKVCCWLYDLLNWYGEGVTANMPPE